MTSPKTTQVDVWLDDPSFGPLQRIGVLSRGDRGALDVDERRPDLEAVLSTALYYRLTKRRAIRIVDRIRKTVSGWEAVARANGLSSRECAEAKHLFVGIE